MRIVLADLKATDGFVSKDTVAGGYGSRFRPFSRVTSVIGALKKHFHDRRASDGVCRRAGGARGTRGGAIAKRARRADLLVLSSLVDYRRETVWAEKMRARHAFGFIGLAASKLPQRCSVGGLRHHGEPEAALARLFQGETLDGIVQARPE